MDVTSPAGYFAFFQLEGGDGQRSSFVYRTIISGRATFGLVLRKLTTHGQSPQDRGRGGGGNEAGFLYDADPSPRQGLAALAPGRPRSVPARRRVGVQ